MWTGTIGHAHRHVRRTSGCRSTGDGAANWCQRQSGRQRSCCDVAGVRCCSTGYTDHLAIRCTDDTVGQGRHRQRYSSADCDGDTDWAGGGSLWCRAVYNIHRDASGSRRCRRSAYRATKGCECQSVWQNTRCDCAGIGCGSTGDADRLAVRYSDCAVGQG